MLMLATLVVEAIGLMFSAFAVALALSWLAFRLGMLVGCPAPFVTAAGAIAVLTVADVFACGDFARISAAFALPMLLMCWVEARGWKQATIARRQV
ncbi:hypothetical protein QH494_19845 [Sphingomonas sp. AR_OL41]|uniref:hypothetical protein n=1 Tax=Sphingomonas sp. AR_OL41 TaxID=3042729 RepID=UPI0024818F67|nr:hypothetical protein [Sphingomonas sp. AR_OL41]MDH7974448.1 hypothetical protein [Sphingomonas sp. AR_OL41]